MRRPSRRATLQVALGVALTGGALGFLSGPGATESPAAAQGGASAPRRAAAVRSFPGLDPLRHRVEDGVAVAELADGSTALLSLHPGLQAHVAGIYARYEVPFGAFVAMDPRSGRVLAYVSHSSADPEAGDLVLDVSPPAASVFKVVTGAALVEAGVDPSAPVCFHGGANRIVAANLEDDPARDRTCASLTQAMGGSINSVFAKLADRHLQPLALARYASAFGFGRALPFDVPTRTSASDVPEERLEFARTAAGFWHMHMSPLHGALLTAAVANDGRMPRATLVDRVIDPSGRLSDPPTPEGPGEVIPAATARAVSRMMRATVSEGTARRAFFDERGNPFLANVEVAGKTGSLTGSEPYRAYSWFVGFAPADEPAIVVSALVVNEPRWRIKAAIVAREALRYWLQVRPREEERAAREAQNGAAQDSTGSQPR